ncbi:hypothetical protein UU9_12328 [Rhodanobacter fulvus Jip2]|uniref:Bacteriophage protein n=1 Tax=Rhodanobacter fulvus Jip2 TaxID=1163408 RepID=I4VMU4_9GAMM|nr:hypothetical protein [Rhodanobacter fulvus]EIL88535.1 hypothetical protein UU9_12328 [Rhodanobacter fulvus Jip2]
MAKINLSRAITLNKDDGTVLELPAGEQTVDKDVASHWFVQAHLVGATDDGEAAENEAREAAEQAEKAAAAEREAAENEAKGKEAAKGKTTTGKSTG